MARSDALLQLHVRLASRRKELLGTIEEQMGGMQVAGTGDDIDFAAVSMNSELTSQLAEHESRELKQIERAMHRLREGQYGICEVCEKKIPIDRLNALPYTGVCVGCQRELETNPELREQVEQRAERALLGEDDEEETEREEEESAEPVDEEPEDEAPRRRGPGRRPGSGSSKKPVVVTTPPAKPAVQKVSAVKRTTAKPAVASKSAKGTKSNAKAKSSAKTVPAKKPAARVSAAKKAPPKKSNARAVAKAKSSPKAKAKVKAKSGRGR